MGYLYFEPISHLSPCPDTHFSQIVNGALVER